MASVPVVSIELTNDFVDQKSSIINLMVTNCEVYLTDVKKFFADVMTHEQEMETDVVPNIALPHAKSSAVKTPFIAVAKNKQGVLWNNNNKVKLVVLIGAPEHASQDHLTIIAKLASNLAMDDFVEDLLNSNIDSIADKIRGLYE